MNSVSAQRAIRGDASGNGAPVQDACEQRRAHAFAPPRAAPRRQVGGFTLIEVVIAFGVLALGLTLLLGTLSGSARQVRQSADAARAALHAQSVLAQTGVGEFLTPGTRDGEFDDGRYRWTMQIDPYTDPLRPKRATVDPGAPRLLALTLTMRWGEGGPRERLQIDTLRLAPVDTSAAPPP